MNNGGILDEYVYNFPVSGVKYPGDEKSAEFRPQLEASLV